MRKFWIIATLLALSQFALAERTLDTLSLQQANAEQVMAAIRPHLSEGSSISQYRNQLVINATDQEWQTIRQLVAQLDQRGKQLLISVKTANDQAGTQRGFNVEGNWGNDDVRISTSPGGLETETRTRVTVRNRGVNRQGSGGQQVRATEGYPAYITAGQAVPYTASDAYGTVTRFKDVGTGFYVTARVDQDRVTLTIDQKNDRLKNGDIKTQQLSTRVTGTLGQWIAIGNVGQSEQDQKRELLGYQQQNASGQQPVYLKVDLAH